ncbi:MAG: helix-turn-helix transcriptional regulator [Acidimicrobiia bacterium]
MSPKKLVSGDDVLARQMKDPAFRVERDATSLARAVAIEVVKYRADHVLSQAALAKQLGVSQPVVARLERGDHTPTWDTLSRLARTMDVEFLVEVHPTTGPRLRQVS